MKTTDGLTRNLILVFALILISLTSFLQLQHYSILDNEKNIYFFLIKTQMCSIIWAKTVGSRNSLLNKCVNFFPMLSYLWPVTFQFRYYMKFLRIIKMKTLVSGWTILNLKVSRTIKFNLILICCVKLIWFERLSDKFRSTKIVSIYEIFGYTSSK